MLNDKIIAVLGGTGAEGSGLALRWAHAGLSVVIGSRDRARAAETAAQLNTQLGREALDGDDNERAAERADIVVLAVPFAAQQATAVPLRTALAGKVLIDVTVPLKPPRVDRVELPNGRSAVAQLAELLDPTTQVVAAFQNVGAHHLKDLDHRIACDVLVCADLKAARDVGIALAQAAGLKGIHAGPLANAAAVEAMTAVLIAINQAYKVRASGLSITGLAGATQRGSG